MVDTFVAVDIETSGLSPEKNHIIEVGALRVRDGEVVETFSQLINPGYTLPERIVELTGITDEMLRNAPAWNEVCKEIYEFLGDDVLLGHNVAFDYRFLKTFFERENYPFERKLIDTLQIARRIHPELTSRSLENMCIAYGLTNENAHRALDDARVTMELYFAMQKRIAAMSQQERKELKDVGDPAAFYYKVKKIERITERQKNYLNDLLKYHKIDNVLDVEKLTKSEASRYIDKIILKYGKMK